MLAKKFKLPVGTFPRQSMVIWDNENLTLRGVKNNLTHNRVGIVFKKGAFKSAALRNKFKRIVFDFFRVNWADLSVGNLDLLVTLKAAIIGLSPKEINEYLKNNVILRHNIASAARKRFSLDL